MRRLHTGHTYTYCLILQFFCCRCIAHAFLWKERICGSSTHLCAEAFYHCWLYRKSMHAFLSWDKEIVLVHASTSSHHQFSKAHLPFIPRLHPWGLSGQVVLFSVWSHILWSESVSLYVHPDHFNYHLLQSENRALSSSVSVLIWVLISNSYFNVLAYSQWVPVVVWMLYKCSLSVEHHLAKMKVYKNLFN